MHEWVKVNKTVATVGLLLYAKKEIGEIVNIRLPKVGKKVKKDESICILESMKSAIDIYAPISGKIVAVNEKLKSDLNLINQDPENEGWLFKIESTDVQELEEYSGRS